MIVILFLIDVMRLMLRLSLAFLIDVTLFPFRVAGHFLRKQN